MKILIAAKHPPGGELAIGGVQTWSKTVGDELQRLGHEVTYWGPEWPVPDVLFDAGILANVAYTRDAEAICWRVLKVAHGVIPDEQGGQGFAATSEEVAKAWGCDGPVIRQPIDLDFWQPAERSRTLLVRHSYRRGLDYLPELAASLGLTYVHLRRDPPEIVRDRLQRAAVVIATGRAAVEAMACGAPVVIADDRKYQGPLLDPDPVGAMARNYSGRGGVVPTPEVMRDAIVEARKRGSLRAHAEAYHDVRVVTNQILGLLGP